MTYFSRERAWALGAAVILSFGAGAARVEIDPVTGQEKVLKDTSGGQTDQTGNPAAPGDTTGRNGSTDKDGHGVVNSGNSPMAGDGSGSGGDGSVPQMELRLRIGENMRRLGKANLKEIPLIFEQTARDVQLIQNPEIRESFFKMLRDRQKKMDYTPPPVPAEQTPLSNKPPSLDEVVWNTRKKFVDLMRRQDPDDPRWASESGQVYCLQGNYRACFTETQKAVEGGMADAETLTTYGSAAHNLGDNKLASEAAGRALEADPEYAPAHSLKMLSQGRVSTVKLPSSLGAAASASESWAGGSDSGAGDIAEAGA